MEGCRPVGRDQELHGLIHLAVYQIGFGAIPAIAFLIFSEVLDGTNPLGEFTLIPGQPVIGGCIAERLQVRPQSLANNMLVLHAGDHLPIGASYSSSAKNSGDTLAAVSQACSRSPRGTQLVCPPPQDVRVMAGCGAVTRNLVVQLAYQQQVGSPMTHTILCL